MVSFLPESFAKFANRTPLTLPVSNRWPVRIDPFPRDRHRYPTAIFRHIRYSLPQPWGASAGPDRCPGGLEIELNERRVDKSSAISAKINIPPNLSRQT
jgi:hypothetical protein